MSRFLNKDSGWWVSWKLKYCSTFSSLSPIATSRVKSNVGLIKTRFFSSVLVILLVKDTNGTNTSFFLIFTSVNFESLKLSWTQAPIISAWSQFTGSFPYTETRPFDKEYSLPSFILTGFLISNQLKNCWQYHWPGPRGLGDALSET